MRVDVNRPDASPTDRHFTTFARRRPDLTPSGISQMMAGHEETGGCSGRVSDEGPAIRHVSSSAQSEFTSHARNSEF
jgi:hypothetical protein